MFGGVLAREVLSRGFLSGDLCPEGFCLGGGFVLEPLLVMTILMLRKNVKLDVIGMRSCVASLLRQVFRKR